MLNREKIEKWIGDIKAHGDCAQDVRDMAMMIYVRDHMDEHEMHRLTREEAIKWVDSMHGEDPAVPMGGKWTMEQVKPIAIKYGVQPETQEFVELWVAMNAMYSDYFGVAKKYNVLNPDFFADMAMAFLHDRDAKNGKLALYHEYVVK